MSAHENWNRQLYDKMLYEGLLEDEPTFKNGALYNSHTIYTVDLHVFFRMSDKFTCSTWEDETSYFDPLTVENAQHIMA